MVQDNSQLRLDLGLGLRTQGVGSVAKTSAGKMKQAPLRGSEKPAKLACASRPVLCMHLTVLRRLRPHSET